MEDKGAIECLIILDQQCVWDFYWIVKEKYIEWDHTANNAPSRKQDR